MYFRKSNTRPHQFDVQETNVSIPQFYRICNYFSGCWTHMDGLLALDLWDLVIEVLHLTKDKTQPKHNSRQELGHFLIPKPRPNMSPENRRLTK